ncbi:hypothetical protein AYL99_10832 [Fonsecaea erecta]|uniref:Xylanolytic transcriptional activator regulatory domain-containing protein n=1 Tax=Fonsecaea erecta TaxID=1367422 RepID=A0A178Z5Z3_9EURO|nr:hypothetical protein AYL99_10832 [Fonsecaea erecta]OAP55132.1 hypothetical protein AYL99_10832 [Fonsecaea erecta]
MAFDHGDTAKRLKTLDIGFNGVSVSTDFQGTILQISTFHPKHGIVLAEPYEQFDGTRFRDTPYVREYRARMLRSIKTGKPGFGLRFDVESQDAQITLDGLGRATISFCTADGLSITTSLRVTEDGEVIQYSEVRSSCNSTSQLKYTMDCGISVNRASYGQLTEGGPIPIPKSENKFSFADGGRGFLITNAPLGAQLQGHMESNGQPVDMHEAIQEKTFVDCPVKGAYSQTLEIPPRASWTLTAKFNLRPAISSQTSRRPDTSPAVGLPLLWRDQETTSKLIVRRNLEYILGNCAVPLSPSQDAVCLLTDHVALPLGWMRDNYWQIQFLIQVYRNLGRLSEGATCAAYSEVIKATVKGHLTWIFRYAQRPHKFWHRSYLTTGRPKDGAVFQLDQQCYPLLEICDFWETFPGEQTFVEEILKSDAVAQVLDLIESKKDPSTGLFPTDETPGDDLVEYPFHFSSHVLLWHALSRLAKVMTQVTGSPLGKRMAAFAEDVRTATLKHFLCFDPMRGSSTFSYLVDGFGHRTFYHDANDLPTLFAPLWGFIRTSNEKQAWHSTMEFAFTDANEGGYYGDGPFGGLGSVHTPGPWTLGYFQQWKYAQMTGNTQEEAVAWKKICGVMFWDGTFSEAVKGKSKTVSIPRREHDALKARCALLEQALAEAIPSQRERDKLMQHIQAKHSSPDGSRGQHLSRDIAEDTQHLREGRILQDPDGTMRYLGESSGATFLNHLREYMATVFPQAFGAAWAGAPNPDATAFISALGKYQTHDSRPLLTSTVDPHISATKEQAATMLSEFQHSAQDGEGTFASGGIYYWINARAALDEYRGYVDGVRSIEASPNVVTANAAFAVACQFNSKCAPPWETGFGQTFFARAKGLLGNPLDHSVINDATVLALLGFYLLNSNRRDAAYIYVSIAMHILIVHGVHRAWMVDEQGKRLFWTVYVLDRWLSCLMGRPALISDDAIKLDLPRDSSGLPPPDGLRAHIELARVSNYIVSNVYDVARQSEEPLMTTLCIQKSLRLLSSWSENLSVTVIGTEENLSRDRAVGELHMAHNQLIILTVRPLLFINVKRVTADMLLNGRTTGHEITHKTELDLCADAARTNVRLWHRLLNLQRPARLSASSVHYLFNAALALQLYQLLGHGEAQDYEDVGFVISILDMDHSSNKEYAADCAGVLTDFNSLTAKLRNVDLLRAVSRTENVRERPHGLPSNSSIILSPNSETSQTSYTESHNQYRSDSSELKVDRPDLPPYNHQTYNELLSWLQSDTLQQKFDFPHRFG